MSHVNYLSKVRTILVSKILWFFETRIFYPKLLKELIGNRVLQQNSEKALTVFDVGANFGQSITFYQKNFSNLKIYAFEPLPECIRFLKLNFSQKATIHGFALSDYNGKASFYVSPLAETSTLKLPNIHSEWFRTKNSILGLNAQNAYTKIEVEVSTVDNFIDVNEITEIDLLKIDVEGAELEVLKGCTGAFSRRVVKSLQLEVHHNDLRDDFSEKISTLLADYSFVRVASVRHSFGNFTEDLYVLS